MSELSPIAVAGAGAWGTALAVHLARNNNIVHLWGYDPEEMQQLSQQRCNQHYLPDVEFPDSLLVFDDLASAMRGVEDVLVVIPSHAFGAFIEQLTSFDQQSLRVAWGTKGLDPATSRPLHEAVANVLGPNVPTAVVSGPSFAKEVGQCQPTAVCVAGSDAKFVEQLIHRLHSPNFRVYPNDDFLGVQLCGVMKNILAIATGMAAGLGLGANARAALLTRGIAEMGRLLKACGGKDATLLGLAGIGDLVLTCTDNQSRNRRFGLAIGQGSSVDAAQASVGGEVEGLHNTRQLLELSRIHHIELPITQQVYRILFEGLAPEDGLQQLLHRERAQAE